MEGAPRTGTTEGWPYGDSPGAGPNVHLRVLDGIVHAFASAADAEEASIGTTRWAREALGDREATVRIAVPDRLGRLRLAYTEGASRAALHRAQAHREEAFRNKRPSVAVMPRAEGATIRLPMVTRGESVGVLEIVTASREVEAAMPTLLAVASQAAIAFSNLRQRSELSREVAVRGTLAALSNELLGARSGEAAVDAAARFCAEHLGVPAAAWAYRGDERGMELVTAQGVEQRRAAELEAQMGWIANWHTLSSRKRDGVLSTFAELSGAPEVSHVGVDDVLFVAGDGPSGLLAVVEGLLEQILTHLGSVARAQRRNEQLDIALAWTAHEFRGPLVGVTAMIEQILGDGGDPAERRRTLEDLRSELQELVGLVEPVLQWAAGTVPLQRRRTDVVELVREAANSVGSEGHRIGITGAKEVSARVDANHLRTAISNLIRNAMAYSPAESSVAVTIDADEEAATISVADRGPGVPPSEREAIFDPFMRGQLGQTTRFGKGLGLFIARRVVEAHEGKIWVESPDGQGAIFHLTLPLT